MGLTEEDISALASKAAERNLRGASEAVVATLVGASTGHPLLGVTVGKLASAVVGVLEDPKTQQFLQAADDIEQQRARAAALKRLVLDTLAPEFHEIRAQSAEQSEQLRRYLERNLASAESQGVVLDTLREFRDALISALCALGHSSPPRAPVLFEGPGRVPATRVPHFHAEQELAELLALLSGDTPVVCVVAQGMGGIGKTTLAREFVARHGPELFPEGVAWLDACDLAADLPRVASRFGHPDGGKLTVDQARAWLCTELHPRRVLLVLDNVDPRLVGLDHICIPGGRCRTLATSRNVTVGDVLRESTRSLPLDQWPLARCRSFLRRAQAAFEHEPDSDLDALAELVGGLPLALRLIAVHPTMTRGLGARGLLAGLRGSPLLTLDRYASKGFPALRTGVLQTFESAFLTLTDDEQIVFRALAVCARSTRPDAVAAAAGVPEPTATQALNRLADVSLVQYIPGAHAPWGLHDVLRFFAQAQDDTTLQEVAHQGWVEASVAAHSDPTDYESLDRVLDEGLAVVDRLAARGEGGEASRVFRPLFLHMFRRGDYARALESGHRVLAVAQEGSLDAAKWLGNLGLCYGELGDVRRAIELHERSLATNVRHGCLEGQAAALGNLGLCYQTVREFPKAIRLHVRSLAINKRLGRSEGQAKQLGNLGLCYQTLDDIANAIKLHMRALHTASEIQYLEGQAVHLGNLGLCHQARRDIPRAIALLEQALTIDEQLGHLQGQARHLGNLGVCHQMLGDVTKARDYLTRCLALYSKMGVLKEQPYFTSFQRALNALS